MSHRYRYCGLCLDVQETINSLATPDDEVSKPDITVRYSSLKPPGVNFGTSGPNWLVRPDEAWWWLPERVYFRIRPGAIDIDARSIEKTLLYSLLLEAPMVMGMIFQGHFCLNAATAVKDSQTLVFCGAAGSGRSTAAARIALQGGKILTDSVARVEPSASSTNIIPQGSGTLLWPESFRRLGISEDTGEFVRKDSLLRRIKLDHEKNPQPLDRIYWRNPHSQNDSMRDEVLASNAPGERQRFKRLALATAGRMWIDAAGRTAEHFRWCLEVARHCQISSAPECFFDSGSTITS